MMVYKRALEMFGKKGGYPDNIQSQHVANYAIFGNKNYGSYQPKKYLSLGTEVKDPKDANIIVGLDGQHVGVVVEKGKSVIHLSEKENKVVKIALPNAKNLFRKGYQLRNVDDKQESQDL